MAVRLTVVGSSPAWPNPGGAQSGYLVEDGGGRLLLDCGPGVLARLRELDGGWPLIDAVVITHWHLDHWGDLVPWVWGSLKGPGAEVRPAQLWLPPEGRERIRDFGARLGWDDMFDQTFEIRDYRGDEPFQAAGFTVLARRLPHYTLLTFGLRVTNGSHLDGTPRGHLSAEEALDAYRASGARRLLLTHRPGELPLDNGVDRAYDGMVVELG